MEDASFRVSDADREQAVISLREHLVAGRLTLDEFSERVEAALRARSAGELARVNRDLPEVSADVAGSRRKPARFTAALFGDITRRGRLRLRGRTLAASAFANLDFDLREATIEQPQAAVIALVAFGNVDVYVPEGLDVDVGGFTIFGHRREWGREAGRPGAPTLRIRIFGCFATADVWRVPHDMRGSYADIVRRLEALQRELPA